jgi:hypothetical protein
LWFGFVQAKTGLESGLALTFAWLAAEVAWLWALGSKHFYQLLALALVLYALKQIGVGRALNWFLDAWLPDPDQAAKFPPGYGRYAIQDFEEVSTFGDARLGSYPDAASGMSAQRHTYAPKFEE